VGDFLIYKEYMVIFIQLYLFHLKLIVEWKDKKGFNSILFDKIIFKKILEFNILSI
jgi:hypothetical protein